MPPVEKKRMTAADKKAACSMLETLSINQQSPGAAFSAVTACFDVCRTTTACLWKQIQSKIPNLPTNEDDDDGSDSGDNIVLDEHIPAAAFDTNMSTRRKGKFKHDRDDVKAKVAAIPFSKRRRTRMLTAQLEMPQSSLMHTLKEKGSVFKQHSNAIKLKLTEENQQARLQFELLKINLNTTTPTRRGPPQPKFNTLFDEVHVDEKWFYLCHGGKNCIIVCGEEPPKRHVSHKSHVTKVMFLCAQARPRRLHNGTWWDGKIDIWPIAW